MLCVFKTDFNGLSFKTANNGDESSRRVHCRNVLTETDINATRLSSNKLINAECIIILENS